MILFLLGVLTGVTLITAAICTQAFLLDRYKGEDSEEMAGSPYASMRRNEPQIRG